MQQDKSVMRFERSTEQAGLFSAPVVTFLLSSDRGAMGRFSISLKEAEFSSPDGRDDFRIRRNFWGYRWKYAGDDERDFARISFGLLHQKVSFADGAQYRIKIKRRWRLRAKAADEYNHLATFFRDEQPVLELRNNAPMPFFSGEVSVPMSGVISTDITDIRVICGLLLLFQSSLMMRRAAAASG